MIVTVHYNYVNVVSLPMLISHHPIVMIRVDWLWAAEIADEEGYVPQFNFSLPLSICF